MNIINIFKIDGYMSLVCVVRVCLSVTGVILTKGI